MKRPALVWTVFFAALAVALGVMLFFTAKMLDFERSIAEAQAHAALEETVRLALWRMDSTAAVLLKQDTNPREVAANGNAQIPDQNLNQHYDPRVQTALSYNELMLRRTLDPSQVGDWQKLAPILLDRISDILPGAQLEPAGPTSGSAGDTRMLATIPARLVVPPSALPNSSLPWHTPARIALMIAWICALLAAAAIAQLLGGTLALSNRRGTFASAVTHELRTPLTTFRMYAEMLATGMVKDEPARRQYLDTLVAESDRLGHLIENVLTYSRLENRISARCLTESRSLQELVDRALPLLNRRAEQAGMSINVTISDPAVECRTDPVAVGQILMNLVDNACKYGRSPIDLIAADRGGHLEMAIRDHGPGVSSKQVSRLFRPFSKSKTDTIPGIGLGLFVSRQLARGLGGSLEYVTSSPGATFVLSIPASSLP